MEELDSISEWQNRPTPKGFASLKKLLDDLKTPTLNLELARDLNHIDNCVTDLRKLIALQFNIPKYRILRDAKTRLDEMINSASQSASQSQSEANAHKGAMESRYDTFKEEAQYLSGAQRARISDLERFKTNTEKLMQSISSGLYDSKRIGAGSLSTLELEMGEQEESVKITYLIIPYAPPAATDPSKSNNVTKLKTEMIGNTEALVISQENPIARELMGKEIGDEVELKIPSSHVAGLLGPSNNVSSRQTIKATAYIESIA